MQKKNSYIVYVHMHVYMYVCMYNDFFPVQNAVKEHHSKKNMHVNLSGDFNLKLQIGYYN